MICMTLDCVRPTRSSVIWIIHRNVGLRYFCIHLPKCLSVIIAIRSCFSYTSQGSVETHLWCGGIYHNHIIANYSQSVPVKEF